MAQLVKNLCASSGDARDVGSLSGSGRSSGVGNGNPLQYSCLENSVDRGAWWATARGIEKNQIQLSTHLSRGGKVPLHEISIENGYTYSQLLVSTFESLN